MATSGIPVDGQDWYEYLIDTLEGEEPDTPLDRYRPNLTAGSDPISDFFRQPNYPYPKRLDIRTYYQQKRLLQIELVKLQNWVKQEGRKLLVIFEGRDAAGKGSAIKRFMEYLDPRAARVVALVKPTEIERGQWYFQRYVQHLPNAGEVVFFDRSWYNRAGVERVMGFCTDEQYWDFVRHVPAFEAMLIDADIDLFKFYLSISKQEQAHRFAERQHNPLKQWKLSSIDLEAQALWDAYTDAKEQTFRLTNQERMPWTIIKADDKLRARLEAMRVVLARFPYTGRDDAVVGAPDANLVADASLIYSEPARLSG